MLDELYWRIILTYHLFPTPDQVANSYAVGLGKILLEKSLAEIKNSSKKFLKTL